MSFFASKCTSHSQPSYANLAGLSHSPPYYFIFTATAIKPVLNAIVFGPPRPELPDPSMKGTLKHFGKQSVQLAFLGLTAAQAVADVSGIVASWRADWSVWQKFGASLIIIGISSNIQSYFSAMGLWNLLNWSSAWSQSHGFQRGMTKYEATGPIGYLYINFLVWSYGPLWLVITVASLPAMVAYIYILLLLLMIVGCAWAVAKQVVPTALGRIRGPVTHDAMFPIAEDDADILRHAKAAGMRSATSDPVNMTQVREDYEKEMNTYKLTGVPDMGWGTYFLLTFFPAIIMNVFTPLAIRLYTGRGYWASLTMTLGERHILTYTSCSLMSVASVAGGFALWF